MYECVLDGSLSKNFDIYRSLTEYRKIFGTSLRVHLRHMNEF